MSITLSGADVVRLQSVTAALLSPLDHRSPAEWAHAVMEGARSLLAADQAFFGASEDTAGRSVVRLWGHGPFTEEAARAYERHFYSVDPWRRKALDLEVFNLDMVFDRSEYERSELFVDWSTPHRLLDAIGMSVKSEGGFSAVLTFYHDRLDGLLFGDRGLALLRLLLPAFRAGVHTSVRLAHHRDSLARLFDDVSVGIGVCDAAGRIIHQNRTLAQLLAADPEAARIRVELRRVAAAVSAAMPTNRGRSGEVTPTTLAGEVRTARGRYLVRGTYTGAAFAGTGAGALVLLERAQPQPLSDLGLRERYMLTPREVEVAHLLGQGSTNADVAETLGISSHTAERHTEHVLSKLGVRSRASVGAKLVVE
jgi:DNA-binding NarL/FixJ family response regulator